MNADGVVIGSGIGGLSAAIRLAIAGKRIVVLERQPVLGGKAGEWMEAGFRWDTGPSVITMLPVIEDLFTSAGRRMQDYLEFIPNAPLTRYLFSDGRQINVWRDLPKTLEAIKREEPADVDGYLAFLAYAARLFRLTSPIFTFGPPPSMKSISRIALPVIPWVSLQVLRNLNAVIYEHVQSPYLRQILGRFATYAGSSPFLASAVLSVIAHVELNEGSFYPRGGVYSIVEALERLATEKGVEIRRDAEVTSIRCEDTGSGYKTRGVVINHNTTLDADFVLANLDVAAVYENLLPATPSIFKEHRRISKMDPSSSAFILLLGVETTNPDLAHHNILFSPDYRQEFKYIFHDKIPANNPTIYIAITCKTDAGHAPPGCENWFVMVNVPALSGNFDWVACKDEYTRLVFCCLAERGYDIKDKVRTMKIITPIDLEENSAASRGALYGISLNDRLAPLKRPANRCREVDGLFFVGGSTHPGGGVPMVMLSAKVVADLIISGVRSL